MNYQNIKQPVAPDAELSVIGSIFNECGEDDIMINLKSSGVTEDFFYDVRNRNLFKYALEKNSLGEKIDLIELGAYAHQHPEKYGDASHVASLFRYSNSFIALGRTIETLREMKIRRELIKSSIETMENSSNLDSKLDKILTRFKDSATGIQDSQKVGEDGKTMVEAISGLKDVWDEVRSNNGMRGLSYGLDKLDLELKGAAKGDLIVFAGKPSMGKSVSILQMVCAAAKDGKRALVFSLEMEKEQVAARMVSCISSVDFSKTLSGADCNKSDLRGIRRAAEIIQESKSLIFDKGDQSMEYIESHCKVENDKSKVDLIAIDYYQLIESPDNKEELRRLEYVSRRLKQLAKVIGCPVVTGAQLNTNDLVHGSTALGKDANVLLRIVDDGENSGYVVDKSRNTQRGQFIPCYLNGSKQRFV
jgi:replicative DNA helicase